jgi:hypothetical protein
MYNTTVMIQDDNALKTHSTRGWIVSFVLLLVGIVYITSFGGRAADLLPEPFNRWSYVYYPLLEPWWYRNVFVGLSQYSQHVLLRLATNMVLGLIVPAALLLLCRRKLTDVGIGLPNILGWRIIIVSIAISIPFGLWLLASMPDRSNMSLTNFGYYCGLLIIIPEHFLICGTYVAIMLPDRKLPHPVSMAPVEGNPVIRLLRWLGLAQPSLIPGHNRFLAWFGLSGASLFAILVSGILFGIVHIGKPHTLELILSFPGGVAVAYITLRSHSIWPAIAAHWAMNLIPLGILTVFQ